MSISGGYLSLPPERIRKTFDQLPEQIRKYYQDQEVADPYKLTSSSPARICMDETIASIMYDGPEPAPERTFGWVDCWKKAPDGSWAIFFHGWMS
jgi:hypothetical protein